MESVNVNSTQILLHFICTCVLSLKTFLTNVKCSGDSPIPLSTLGTSYVAATGGALVTALGKMTSHLSFLAVSLCWSLRHLFITVIFEDNRLQSVFLT